MKPTSFEAIPSDNASILPSLELKKFTENQEVL